MTIDASPRTFAVRQVLVALRSPLVLISIHDRERVTGLIEQFEITALDLLTEAHRRARNA
jgi:hypothetical protein